MQPKLNLRRNEIYMAKLPDTSSCVQYGRRPVLIVQNDVGNEKSPTTIVAPLTSRIKRPMPTHVLLGQEVGLYVDSVVMCEQLMTVSKTILEEYIGQVTNEQSVKEINEALKCSLGLK